MPQHKLLGDRLVGHDLAGALRHPAVLTAADAVLRGERERVVEFEMASPVERHLSARLARLSPPTAEGSAAILLLHDLTELKRSERLRADFVANASHELRTPLAALVGFIETLRGPARNDTAARERFLAIMAEQAGRMSRLVDDLLSLSRIEMNEHRAPTAAVDIGNVLHAVADTLEQRAAARHVRFVFKLPEGLPAVLGDFDELDPGVPEPLRQCDQIRQSRNRYRDLGLCLRPGPSGHPGRPARQRRRHRGARSWAGIPRDFLPRLTERFYRVDPARSRELGGTGLGLAIVKHIVNHHRGALDIDSEIGQGSVFTVHLPVATPSG